MDNHLPFVFWIRARLLAPLMIVHHAEPPTGRTALLFLEARGTGVILTVRLGFPPFVGPEDALGGGDIGFIHQAFVPRFCHQVGCRRPLALRLPIV